MQVDYLDLIEEIEEITTVDGFIAACLEIKESMFFYDRELMLAAYVASLELLATVALFGAALQGSKQLKKAETQILHCGQRLLEELAKFRLPLDIQFVVDSFLQEAGQQFGVRLPVYLEMIRNYAQPKKEETLTLDALLLEAHQVLESVPRGDVALDSLLGRVGRKMLRGAHLRPIWLEISHPRIYLVLVGLQTLMNNFRVTPYFNFPLEEIGIERQKRKKVKGNIVSDLGVVRNFREGGSGYTDLNVVLTKDDYDSFLEKIYSAENFSDLEPDRTVIDLIKIIFKVRLVHDKVDDEILLPLLDYCKVWELEDMGCIMSDLNRLKANS